MRVEYDDQAAGIAPERYLYLPTVDDEAPSLEDLEAGAAFVAREIARGVAPEIGPGDAPGAVYVHCSAGVGRAPTMVAAYLVRTGLSPEQAWARIRQARPFVRPTPPQIEQLERFAAWLAPDPESEKAEG
jgi:protein-tyrosine phosphatase